MKPNYLSFRDNEGNLIGAYDPQVEGSFELVYNQIDNAKTLTPIQRTIKINALCNAAERPIPKEHSLEALADNEKIINAMIENNGFRLDLTG